MATRPTHYPGGLSNTSPGDPLYMYPFLDPSKYHLYYTDFDLYTAADWTVTKSTTSATNVITTGDGGLAAFGTGVSGTTSLISNQWKGNSGAATVGTFTFDTTKFFFMKVRVKTSVVASTRMMIGVAGTSTTPFDGVIDRVVLSAVAGAAILTVSASGGSTSTSTAGTMTADTFCTIAVAYIPGTGFQVFFNDALASTLTSTANAPASTSNMSITMACDTTNTSTQTEMTVDYLLSAKER